MINIRRGVDAVVLAAALLLAGPRLANAAPLEAYGRLPAIEDAQLSPGGGLVAYILTDGENRSIVIRQVSDGKVVGGLRAGDTKVRGLAWASDDFLLVTQSQLARSLGVTGTRREYVMTIVYDLRKGRQRNLMEAAENSMNVVAGSPNPRIIDGDPIVVVPGVNFVEGAGQLGLFRVNLKTGRTILTESGTPDVDGWVVGGDGQALARTEYDEKTGEWRLGLRRGAGWAVALKEEHPVETPYLAGLGRDGRSALLVDATDDERPLLTEFLPGGEAPTQVSATGFHDLITDPATGALIGVRRLVGDEDRYQFFDARAEAIWKGVSKAYPGDRVSLVSWTNDRQRLIVKVDSRTAGPALAFVDLTRGRADWIGDLYTGLKPADIAEVRTITYKAADGLEITGYLTLPRGRDPKGLPLIVLPHGGPASRDEPEFDWWAQALASRGYAVLQPNFRGSSGYGHDFLAAGFGEFGRKMQTDLSDGVRDLAARGMIDAKRVCIVGASYGGYAALAGATLDRGVYRCAASVAGISDLGQFLKTRVQTGRTTESAALRYWTRFFGADDIRSPALAAISPVTFADRVDIPILLIHGRDDTVVAFNQSQIMADALKRAGKPVDLVELQGEDHWLSRGDTRLLMLQSLVAFLEKHNPPT